MCLVLLAWQAHPNYRLIVAANRDEYHARATTPAAFWPDAPEIFAGRDEQAGGTWMGVDRNGRFAAVTNFRSRSTKRTDLRSRGALCTDFLQGQAGAAEAAARVSAEGQAYNGFSLLLADVSELHFVSNQHGPEDTLVPPGVHGLSNDRLDEPWPKVRLGRERLNTALGEDEVNADHLLAILADRTPAADADLPDTGVGLELERRLSSLFIEGDVYGTRSSAVILIDDAGEVDFTERSYDAQGRTTGTVQERFAIRSSAL